MANVPERYTFNATFAKQHKRALLLEILYLVKRDFNINSRFTDEKTLTALVLILLIMFYERFILILFCKCLCVCHHWTYTIITTFCELIFYEISIK